MLASTKEMLLDAQRGHYAVGAFNIEDLEFVMAVVKAADEMNSPVILQTTPGSVKYADLDYFYAMVAAAAKKTRIPIALHLDHGEGFALCMRAIHAGYTSVMIDGSHDPFETNIAITASVARVGAAMGVPVEAELGKVGGKEDDGKDAGDDNPFTNPDEAEEFVLKTGCTSLAVGVGTAHGIYKGSPRVEQDVLKAIASRVEIPLVLHGTSGVPDEQVKEAIQNGVCKVNYATELRQAYMRGFMHYMQENPDAFDPKKPAALGMQEIEKVVASHIQNLGSDNKA